jgi:glycosyltransferase involved in cell wall biosynthesis
MSVPLASIVFPTRNRKDMLREAILSALNQSVPVEIIVMDDGSNDGTEEMMRRDFPGVHYYRFAGGKGPCFLRNRGIEVASSEIVFSPDDDSCFASTATVEQTLREFDEASVAAMAIPFVNVRRGPEIHQRSPTTEEIYVVHAYVGAAHAVRRHVFLELGGYREHLYYMGEEGDLCVRMLEGGYLVRLGAADPIHHFESPNRVTARADFYGRRNDVLFAWQNVPAPFLSAHLVGTVVKGLLFAITRGQYSGEMLRGMWTAFKEIARGQIERKPVRRHVYRLFRRLKKEGPLPLNKIEGLRRQMSAL